MRVRANGVKRGRGIATALRRNISVRTFADWKGPAPGYMEADLVAHCGSLMAGSFVHSFVLVDVATGWTECMALVARDQHLIVKGLERTRARLPFPLRGFDTRQRQRTYQSCRICRAWESLSNTLGRAYFEFTIEPSPVNRKVFLRLSGSAPTKPGSPFRIAIGPLRIWAEIAELCGQLYRGLFPPVTP